MRLVTASRSFEVIARGGRRRRACGSRGERRRCTHRRYGARLVEQDDLDRSYGARLVEQDDLDRSNARARARGTRSLTLARAARRGLAWLAERVPTHGHAPAIGAELA